VAGELALNTNDGRLFYKDSAGVVQTMASKATGSIGGSTTQIQFNNSGVLGGSASLTWSGTVLTSSGFAGPLNGTVGATTPASGSFTTTTIGTSETLSYGTANGVAYLNGSKVLTSGSALTFDGSQTFSVGTTGGNVKAVGTSGITVLSADTGSNNIQVQSRPDISYSRLISSAYLLDIATSANQPILFTVNNSEQMRLTSTGLGIGTSSPSTKLDVNGDITQRNGSGISIGTISNATGWYQVAGTANVNGVQLWSGSAPGAIRFGTGASFTEQMRLDSSGNVGIGTSSPSGRLHVATTGAATNVFVSSDISTSSLASRILLGNSVGAARLTLALNGGGGEIAYLGPEGSFPMYFQTNGTERMRIDSSGNLLVGTTSTISAFNNKYRQVINPVVNSSAQYGLMVNANANAYTQYAVVFADTYSEQIVGSISFTTSATAYNTSSDCRLKNTIAPMTGALAKVALLKPCTYKWNVDGSDGEGFIAHELAEVVPQAVTGLKDELDAEGNPVYQGIDTSFLVATLTAAIQEQQALIQDLTTRLVALEAK
jgi:hypothetical protein